MNTPEDKIQPGEDQNFDLRDTENLLTATLDRHATEAPADHTLLSAVHRRLRRRRTGRTVGAAVLACAAVAVAVTAGQALTGTPPRAPKPPAANTGDVAAKAGWRWESFKTVQVQVPASWNHYVAGLAPCTYGKKGTPPTVGRFYPWQTVRSIGCAVAVRPLAERQEYLWFDDVQKPGVKQYDGGWTEETRDVDGVHVTVLTQNDELRRQILDSAVKITDRDAYGCEAAYRPTTNSPVPLLLASLGTVTSVDICEYWGGGVKSTPDKPLVAGSRLERDQAEAVGEALDYRPQTTPPEMDGMVGPGCTDDGGRTYKFTIRGTNGNWKGTLVYSPCLSHPQPEAKALELIRTGVHRQGLVMIEVPGIFTPPQR
jgi:hypothetical protein